MSASWRGDDHAEPSIFRPAHLLREARRQRGLPDGPVPALCVLDPDGDLARYLSRSGRAQPSPHWACYHTEMVEFALDDGTRVGVVGCAVGAPFAVLVAEQLFASGCRLAVSITSSGRVADLGPPPYTVMIDRALRDEGTSARYLEAASGDFVAAPLPGLLDHVERAACAAVPLHRGATWTTDAPYRETASAIERAAALGVLAVEMEASALYAFAQATGAALICFAQVTNTMGQHDGDDFEKGEADGAPAALRLIEAAAAGYATFLAAS
ncbi:MAG: nucleoside phosphorylase [Pseudomonadota bacterium]|nr:nucleoside phosphorylase [Pseudomonadota bacterium]